MTSDAAEFELLLRRALTPVEPPADMSERIETTLVNLTEMAADELESWELSAMRDPRNWARPVAAVVIGGAAGTGLILLRARRRAAQRRRSTSVVDVAERALREVFSEARRLAR